jgi:hypothetical protein
MKRICSTTGSKKIASHGEVRDAVLHHIANGKGYGTDNNPGPLPASEDHRLQPSTSKSIIASTAVLEELCGALSQISAEGHPRTFRLLQSSRRKVARKVIEEACEVTVEAVKRDADGVVRESGRPPLSPRGLVVSHGGRASRGLARDAEARRDPRHRREAAEAVRPQRRFN